MGDSTIVNQGLNSILKEQTWSCLNDVPTVGSSCAAEILELWVAAQGVETWIYFHVVQERRVFPIGLLQCFHCCFGLAQSDVNHGKLVLKCFLAQHAY